MKMKLFLKGKFLLFYSSNMAAAHILYCLRQFKSRHGRQISVKHTSLFAADVSPLVLIPDLAEKKSRLLLMNFPI